MILARGPATAEIFPFLAPASALLFGGPSLRELQEEEAARCGLRVVDVDGGPCPEGTVAWSSADCVFSAGALTRVLEIARSKNKIVRASIAEKTALAASAARLGGDLVVPLLAGALAGKEAVAEEDVVVADEAGAVVVDVKPWGVPPHELRIADVERLLGRPQHWLHVLDLSLAAARTRLRRREKQKWQKKPSVHPTALVENSVLGEGVRVDAHCAVIDSVVGDGVNIADHTVIHSCVIGARCRTLVDTHLRRCVAMPGSTLSNLDMQDAIFGRDVFLTTGVAFFPAATGEDVVVDGVSSGRAVLSGAIGAGAILGSRALFRSGVALPPKVLVVARPGEALGRFDDKSLEKAGVARDG